MTVGPPLLLDEMLSGDIAAQLRNRGRDVTAVVDDPALVGLPDDEVLAHAASEGRCLITANIRDFTALSRSWLAAGRDHAGIAYLSTRTFPQNRGFVGAVVTALDKALVDGTLPSSNAEAYLQPVG